jgi:hypothetical protein
MTFDEIPQRVWVYLSLKMNQFGTSVRDLVVKPTPQGRSMLIELIRSHLNGYLEHENKSVTLLSYLFPHVSCPLRSHPHRLSERFLESEREILEKWLAEFGEQR